MIVGIVVCGIVSVFLIVLCINQQWWVCYIKLPEYDEKGMSKELFLKIVRWFFLGVWFLLCAIGCAVFLIKNGNVPIVEIAFLFFFIISACMVYVGVLKTDRLKGSDNVV